MALKDGHIEVGGAFVLKTGEDIARGGREEAGETRDAGQMRNWCRSQTGFLLAHAYRRGLDGPLHTFWCSVLLYHTDFPLCDLPHSNPPISTLTRVVPHCLLFKVSFFPGWDEAPCVSSMLGLRWVLSLFASTSVFAFLLPVTFFFSNVGVISGFKLYLNLEMGEWPRSGW